MSDLTNVVTTVTPPGGTGLGESIVTKLARKRSYPVGHLELMLTEDCNHRCDYCFVKHKVAPARDAL